MDIGLIIYPVDTNPAGVGVNVENLTRHILEQDQDNNYYLLHFTPSDHPLYRRNEVRYRRIPYLPPMFSDSWYVFRHSHKFDIIHRFLPGGFIFGASSKIVITVHDLFMYKRYPFNRSIKIPLARLLNRNALLRADAIIADSRFTKQELLDTFPIDAEKVHVIYSAPQDLSVDSEKGRALLDPYDLPEKYILFVSTIEPRKNLLSLIKAFEVLKESYGVEESLVIVGKEGWGYASTWRYIENSQFRPYIKRIGYVPAAHLAAFYQHASLFVYPSFMEGFGIPPLEAMACGCPVLTANTSSLPEVVRHGDMMFDPEDIQELVSKSLRILTDPADRGENIAKGAENVKRFSWEESAKELIEIYNNLGER